MTKIDMKNQVVLSAKNVCKSFRDIEVLKNVSFEIKKGEVLVVLGESGTGKSVLLNCMLGMTAINSGSIMLNSTPILENSELPPIGVVFQSLGLFPNLLVWQNIVFNSNIGTLEAIKIAEGMLKEMGIQPHVAMQYPQDLSGGMQRRMAICRAIMCNSQILMLDEPTSGLDPLHSKRIRTVIKQSIEKHNSTAFIITHDRDIPREIATHVALLHRGSIVWYGTPSEMEQSDYPYLRAFLQA